MKNKKLIIIIIFLLIFITRLLYISNSTIEIGNTWRQSDTESIARNFIRYKFNIFYPQFNYDGPIPNYVNLEFQITTYIIAILYKVFGYHYELARLVPILFFMGSVYYLYLISKKYYDIKSGILTIIVYSLLPINIFYSRAIMPESAGLFFFVGGFYYFSKWIDDDNMKALILSSLFTALAISQKTPTIFVGIPMIYMAIKKYKIKVFANKKLYLFAFLSLVPPIIYSFCMAKISEFNFLGGIASKHILPKFYTAIFTKEGLGFFQQGLPWAFSIYTLILFVLAIFLSNWKKEDDILVWVFAIFLEFITIVAVIRFNYYLIFMGPPLSLLIGGLLGKVSKRRFGTVAVIALLSIITYKSYKIILPSFTENQTILNQAKIIKKYTEKDDLTVIGSIDPSLLNISDRIGWRGNINYYDYIPKGPKNEISYFIGRGAKYFSPLGDYIYGDDGTYKNYLEENFKKIVDDSGYYIYKLK